MKKAQDYINSRIQRAEELLPNLKSQLAVVVEHSLTDFIDYGKISLKEYDLSNGIYQLHALSTKHFRQLCDWLAEFGWIIVTKENELYSSTSNQHIPKENIILYLIPTEYLDIP